MSDIDKKKISMSGDDFPDTPVPKSHRVTWHDLTFVWFGAAMVAQLYVCGVVLGTGTGGLTTALEAILWGALFLAVLVGVNGIIGQATGCNAALSGTYAYGRKGVAISGFHIADIGWYVVNIAIFSSIMSTILPAVDIRVFAILFCYLFMTNGYIGFNQMVILNKLSFPVLFLVSIYGLYQINSMPGGIIELFDKNFTPTISLMTGITMVIGTWSAGASRSADYFRFALRKRDSMFTALFGFFGGFALCIGCGAIWGAALETTDIGQTLVMLNMIFLGSLMFFIQTWTTSEHSAYITSTSVPLTVKIVTGKSMPRRYMILVVGIIGVLIAGLDIQNYYVPFIVFLGYFIPVISAIVLADYFIMSKTKYHWTGHKNIYSLPVDSEEVQHHSFNIAILPTIIVGFLVSYYINWGIGAVNALVGTVAAYCLSCFICYQLGVYDRERARNCASN